MDLDGRLKRGEKKGEKNKSNGGSKGKRSNGGKNKSNGGRKGKSRIPEQEQNKKVLFGEEEEPLDETRAESTDEPEVTGRLAEVRTGRGSAGLVRGGDERHWADESSRKGKGKGNGGKGEHVDAVGGAGSKGTQQVENLAMDEDQEAEEEDERGRVAPNMGAGGSHPQATSDPGKEKKETRVLSWADCNDEEVEENEEEVEEEKETGQRETSDERPPGLKEVESVSEQETQEEGRKSSAGGARAKRGERKKKKRAREESAGGARGRGEESARGARGRGEENA